MTLPATYEEAAALVRAKECLRLIGEGDFFDPGYGAFNPEAGRVLLRRIMRSFADLDGAATLALINFAKAGWDDADLAIRQLITERLDRGEPLGSFLSAYNAEILNGYTVRAPRGSKPATNIVADMAIVCVMLELINRFGLKPTRISRRRPSAASVTAQALAETGLHRGGEDAVTKVWQRYGPQVLPGMVGW